MLMREEFDGIVKDYTQVEGCIGKGDVDITIHMMSLID